MLAMNALKRGLNLQFTGRVYVHTDTLYLVMLQDSSVILQQLKTSPLMLFMLERRKLCKVHAYFILRELNTFTKTSVKTRSVLKTKPRDGVSRHRYRPRLQS